MTTLLALEALRSYQSQLDLLVEFGKLLLEVLYDTCYVVVLEGKLLMGAMLKHCKWSVVVFCLGQFRH